MTRDAAAIGAGLALGRPPRRIGAGERIHVVGVGGAGASAAALLARHAGATPSGCDRGGPSSYTPALEAAAIPLAWSHDAAHVRTDPPPDRLAVTKALTAIDPDHPELRAAREAGIPLEPWQQVVADAAVDRTLVGVAGTHGKSTTSGWLVHVLVGAGMDPAAFVGALLPGALTGGLPATARWGSGRQFVVEADEYAGNFDPYRPAVAVLTGAEWDHPDVFADLDAVVETFVAWLGAAGAVHPDPVVVINVGDRGGAMVAERLRSGPTRIVAVALDEAPVGDDRSTRGMRTRPDGLGARFATHAGPAIALVGRIVSADPLGTDVALVDAHPQGGDLRLRLPTAGRHNAANALCVAGAARALGLPLDIVARGLSTFSGVGRRLERKGEQGGVVVYDDYGHHPTAIRETIRAIRQREPGRRVWAVYEPLTYHRTAAMIEPFADALATADAAVIADIWAGRDPDTTIASAGSLAEAVARRHPGLETAAPGSVEQTARWLARHVRPGDAVLVMGGGRSYAIGELLLGRLTTKGEG